AGRASPPRRRPASRSPRRTRIPSRLPGSPPLPRARAEHACPHLASSAPRHPPWRPPAHLGPSRLAPRASPTVPPRRSVDRRMQRAVEVTDGALESPELQELVGPTGDAPLDGAGDLSVLDRASIDEIQAAQGGLL